MILENTYDSLNEGINDPGVFKAVFMAGGPGSGKSLAAKKLGFGSMGLRPVNSDSSFEMGLKKAGLSLKMPESEEEQRDAIRVHAKAITGKRQEMYLKGRLGIVIDSTARDVANIIKQKKLLQDLGYETAMVFVNTSLETALDRNRQRERSIPDNIVQSNHATVRKNMGKLQATFGRQNFFIVDNDGDMNDLDKNTTKIFPRLRAFVKSFPSNKMATAWKSALTMKPMKNIALAASYEHPVDMEKRLFNEDDTTDNLKDKQSREKEQLKVKHDREMDADRRRLTRLKNRSTNPTDTNEVSDAVMATKEKIYKDLKKKKDYFEKEYGDKAKEVMHGTAMNMAKKQHKVAEGKFTSELTRQLQLEVLNMQQRRAIGMRMRRLAQKIARTKARKKKRMKTNDQLKTKAMKQARAILFKKMSGGKAASELAMGARIAIGKKLDKKKGVIQKLSKKLFPKVKKGEVERLKKFRQSQSKK
jgi:predicted kinase